MPEAHRLAFNLVYAASVNPPYLADANTIKSVFDVGFPGWGEFAYRAWLDMSALYEVTIEIDGLEFTGVYALAGAGLLMQGCKQAQGCGQADPCDCLTWYWTNKPASPC